MILTCSNLDYDSLRKIVLIVLKDGEISQYGDIKARVMNHLLENKIIKETSSFSLSSGYSNQLSGQDSEMVLQIVWDLIIERVLTIGYNHLNENWPFLRLTDYGKEIIKQSDNVIIHDIDGMQKMLTTKVPNVDKVIINYFSECLNTYRINCNFASSVMLGCCAERAICLLFDNYLEWLNRNFSDKEYNNLLKFQKSVISRKFDELTKSISGHRANISELLFEDYDLLINSIFTIIRKNRNDAGHPIDKFIDRDELRSMIYVFINHCKKIYEFIDFFNNNIIKKEED